MQNSIAEQRLYAQMALTSSSVAYTWSRWNSGCEDKASLVVQVAECLIDEPIREVSNLGVVMFSIFGERQLNDTSPESFISNVFTSKFNSHR